MKDRVGQQSDACRIPQVLELRLRLDGRQAMREGPKVLDEWPCPGLGTGALGPVVYCLRMWCLIPFFMRGYVMVVLRRDL